MGIVKRGSEENFRPGAWVQVRGCETCHVTPVTVFYWEQRLGECAGAGENAENWAQENVTELSES